MSDLRTVNMEKAKEVKELQEMVDNEKLPTHIRVDASVRKAQLIKEINDSLEKSIANRLD